MKGQARELSAFKFVIVGVSLLAAFPAAYMVGRSVYHFLILGWFENHTMFWPWLGAFAAGATAVVVEGLGSISLYLWATFRRWNRWKAQHVIVGEDGKVTRKLKGGYDLAPEWTAIACFGAYLTVATVLLGVLEWRSDLASFAPVLFPALTAVGGMTWAMFDEHRDRLAFHGLAWNWGKVEPVPARSDTGPKQTEPMPTQTETVPELDETQREILDLWRHEPTLTLEQVGNRFGKSKSWVARQKQGLEQENLVRYDTERGEWAVLAGRNGHAK